MGKPVVGVMGRLQRMTPSVNQKKRGLKGPRKGSNCCLPGNALHFATGATTGMPDMVARAFRREGGFALGISPAQDRSEHLKRYGMPDDGADVIVYTGFGYKGRNVINVRPLTWSLFWRRDRDAECVTIAHDEGEKYRRNRGKRRSRRPLKEGYPVLQKAHAGPGYSTGIQKS